MHEADEVELQLCKACTVDPAMTLSAGRAGCDQVRESSGTRVGALWRRGRMGPRPVGRYPIRSFDMAGDRFERLWSGDWKAVAQEATSGYVDSPNWLEAQAVFQGRVAKAQDETARLTRQLARATIVLAVATVVLSVATIVLVVITASSVD